MKKFCVALLSLIFAVCMCCFAAGVSVFTVTFDGNGGVRVGGGEEVQPVKSAKDIDLPQYWREGYDFNGWDVPPSRVTESCTIKAQWEMWSEYTITLDANGGTFKEGDVTEIKLAYGDNVPALPTLVREDGYSFVGWKIGSAEDGETLHEGSVWEITKNVTAYAVWVEGKANNIKWSLGGGKISGEPPFYRDNQTVDLSKIIPTKTGYTFKGWNIDGDKTVITEIKNRTGEITIVANWEANEYTISFDKNGKEIDDYDSITVIYDGTVQNLPSAKKAKNILAWSKDKDGSEDNIINNGTKWTIAENVTLYAIWVRGDYEITYDLNGGKFGDNVNVPYCYNSGEMVQLPRPTKTGRNFLYWREVDKDGATVADTVTQINSTEKGDRYFVAVYSKTYTVKLATVDYRTIGSEKVKEINYNTEKITIEFNVKEGSWLSSNQIPTGKNGYLDKNDNYKIVGWMIVVNGVYRQYNGEIINDKNMFGIDDSPATEIVLYPMLSNLWIGPY